MRYESLKKIAKTCGASFTENAPLSDYTTFKIGGAAALIININGKECLLKIMREIKARAFPYFVIGRGSNILAADGGYSGVILRFGESFARISKVTDNGADYAAFSAEAGAILASVSRTARENALAGLEFAGGIPGTVGGALRMNAGAYGGEMKDVVTSAECLDVSDGKFVTLTAGELELSYRSSVLARGNLIAVGVTFRLPRGKKSEIEHKMAVFAEKRKTKQPLDYPSAGSFFKRPDGVNVYAAQLIEECGLKGRAIGGAEVSGKHSGFIVNTGGGKSRDVLELAETVIDAVYRQTGIELETEPVFLND
ncbi:UDP-N-acetylenolpyruvoylglucosamine reductase [Clostridia bacterium]|nr:UDP-N-acetylenolpyruvoylglucosamine reductase [Clostridia bacterium]